MGKSIDRALQMQLQHLQNEMIEHEVRKRQGLPPTKRVSSRSCYSPSGDEVVAPPTGAQATNCDCGQDSCSAVASVSPPRPRIPAS